MSLVCPQCQSPLDQDFGIFNCPQCKALLVVDFSGQVQLSQNAEIASESASPAEHPRDFPIAADASPKEKPEPAQEFQEEPLHDQQLGQPLDNFVESHLNFSSEIEGDQSAPENEISKKGLQEVIDFANAAESTGPLSYTLKISGIDLALQKDFLLEVLKDPKFQFNAAEMMNKISAGQLEIPNLNPAQASVLVRKLRVSNLMLSWRQHLYE